MNQTLSPAASWLARLRPQWTGTPRQTLSWALGALVLGSLGLSFMVRGAATPPNIQAIALSSTPLYAATPIDKPSLALALSVEFPTVGSQYPSGGSNDSSYANTTEYLGYYDAESCYTYNDAPSETPAGGLTTTDYKRFDRSGAATNRKCSNAFSGNFLNWATSSAIDMLRLALSGGDRYIDQDGLTILQRAVLPNGDPTCFWNTSNFPAKQLTRNGGGSGTYWGAVPTAMITAANGNDIYVANTLNRIYFGTSATGDCWSGPANYVLNSPASNKAIGTVSSTVSSRGSGTTKCADEGGVCNFTGTKQVWYGASNKWRWAPASNGVDCTNGVFGDPIPGTGKACYIKDYTGTWTPPEGQGTMLNSDGYFFSRVQVCNKVSGVLADVRDYGLCKLYPSGNYKPAGVIQKYSDQLRLAAFGYLMDQTASYSDGRYGGVLRAPMKYVGYKTFDENGADTTPSTGNANMEWDNTTGVFKTNPDGDSSFSISGVINYLNKFGRTGSVAGRYKQYDPVGELHYETLRYLQGLSPSADAISNITTDMKDGFPVYTTWTDPYGGTRSATADYSCVRSNIVVIGDINTHDGNRLPSPSVANNIIDINAWRTVVQNFEQNVTSATYVDGQGVTRNTGNPNGANGGVPSGSSTSQIMGSAYWSHTHDIRPSTWTNAPTKVRPGLRVKNYLFDVNEYGSQSDANNRRFSNQFFMASKYGGFESDASNTGSNPYNTWGNPFRNQSGGADNNVWQNLSSPGEASTYYLQSSARGVLSAFDGIFSRAANSSRNIAGVAIQSREVSTTVDNVIYQGAFDTSSWTGDVLALPLTVVGTSTLTLSSQADWSAADILTNRANPSTTRTIVMGRPGATANPTATDFTWAAITDASIKSDLNKASSNAAADGLGSSRVAFLRGDRSLEGSTFRSRSKLLGDIINSSVVYSGTPTTAYIENSYSTFYTNNKSRTPAVFVGANDGMLHAFNASKGTSGGTELFAYIPSWMSSKLSELTSTSYLNNHQSYVDGVPVVGEACVGPAHTLTATTCTWKTVLASGTGAGGQGVFALDVTDPTAFSASKVMWEFTKTDDADMGYVVGAPQIVKMKVSSNTATTPTYRWFVAVASGVNNYVSDSAGRFSTTGNPAIFFLALDKAAGDAWTQGTNYYKVLLPFDATLAITKATGVANFTPMYGGAGEVTYLFAGDLHGKLWKLDFTPRDATHPTSAFDPSNSSHWTMERLSFFNKGTATTPIPYPMYSATDAATTPNIQPIFSAPRIFTGPVVNGKKTYYVLFGTGKFLEASDKTSTAQNTIYTIFDNGVTGVNQSDSSPTSATTANVISGRGRLQSGTVNTSTLTITVPAFLWGRAASNADTTQRSGWYFDLPSTGEKMISAFLGLTNYATFNTIVPGAAGAAGSCTATPGSGNSYSVNIATGNGTYISSSVGLLGSTMYVKNSGLITPGPSNSTGRKERKITYESISTGSSGSALTNTKVEIKEAYGRLSWRQVNNYWDLHQKATE
ncbi:PilC/PilY family type IV pilus protein [Curvibacter sp. HBC28]|uniref:PilC/PilY family type IV pilus protein n=1 Tax=Curvibacter microcysteis TaxID=3026419 RepID=A0ABT5MF51_9BURK|nr:PilC/PilY family type IV pilus protein [Curvibacter sp. HBC28]MDD0815061.1 PilC/PilY family type IV pilus protein [Curvibacter sp. HBC28]